MAQAQDWKRRITTSRKRSLQATGITTEIPLHSLQGTSSGDGTFSGSESGAAS